MCLAVGIMCSYHLWTIAHGETTVESHDHEVYRRIAKSRNEAFVNSYDLGYVQGDLRPRSVLTNKQETAQPRAVLQCRGKRIVRVSSMLFIVLFIALRSPLYTLFLPFRINPYTDGRFWARREGYEEHRGVRRGEELTDEDDDEEGEA